tara:strand:- start:3647 stop:4231 length:585 start_codon:yes stop_codon:yes gene_type:complete
MNDITRIALGTLIYVLCFSLSVSLLAEPVKASDYVSNFDRIPLVNNKPPQVATWSLTPTVVVCEHAPVTEEQTEKAVDFWKRLGYRFYKTQYKYDPLNKCLTKTPKGYIVIHLVTAGIKMDETSLAQTHFFIDNSTNQIDYALIYLRTDVRETVLEHELGHALGFLHYNKINHLMNEKWMMGGWDTEGLRKARR